MSFLTISIEKGNNKSWKNVRAKFNDNIGVAAIKKNSILYHDNKTKAEFVNQQLNSIITRDDDIAHLQAISSFIYPYINDNHKHLRVIKHINNVNIHEGSGPNKIQCVIFKT